MNGWVLPQLAMLAIEEYLQHRTAAEIARLRKALDSGQPLSEVTKPLRQEIAEKDKQIAHLTDELNRVTKSPKAAE